MAPKAPVWKYTSEKEAELLYLALAARHHCGQQQPIPPNGADIDGGCSEDDDYNASESAAESAGPVSSGEAMHKLLKERFLDSFAELLARHKDPRFVSSCALDDSGKKAKIFVARNAGFDFDQAERSEGSIGDREFFEDFKTKAADLHKDYTDPKAEAMFELLVRYYRSRIEYHCVELAVMSRKTKNVHDGGSKSQKKRIREFHAFRALYQSFRDKGLNSARPMTLAKEAYKLAGTAELEPALRRLFEAGQARRVLRQLRFTARIRAIFHALSDSICCIPNFDKIKIVIVPGHDPRSPEVRMASARAATLAIVQEYWQSVPKWMSERASAAKFESDFQKQSLVVHAEVQLACFFDTNKEFAPISYLGISKKPCHLCGIFLSEMRMFRTRPGHGQLHPYWTLPMGLEMRKQRLRSPAMALKAIEQSLIQMVGRENTTKLAQLPESTAVWSARMASSGASPSIVSSIPSHRMGARQQISASSRKNPTTSGIPPVHAPVLPHSLQPSPKPEPAENLSDDVPQERVRLQLEFLVGLLKVHHDGLPTDVQRVLAMLDSKG